MRKEHLKYLVCPLCKSELIFSEVIDQTDSSVEIGTIQCSSCRRKYDIVRHIPRFVSRENYASGFGLQWTKHAKTQYDSYTKTNISRTRFFNETKWSENLSGEIILEAGSGSGRFTEQAASTGAMVVSMDYSYAVEANYDSNGHKDNVLIVQGDIYKIPFREDFFDKLFCFGVLQHVPNVEEAFKKLPKYLKYGGAMAIDVYNKPRGLQKILNTKYIVRPITKKIQPEKLYRLCKRYIEFMWPIARIINKIPFRGRRLNWILLICDYRGYYPLSDEILKEWAILDTFDMLAPAYDFPQTIETVQRWFKEANLVNIDIQYGYNGIEGRGIRP